MGISYLTNNTKFEFTYNNQSVCEKILNLSATKNIYYL